MKSIKVEVFVLLIMALHLMACIDSTNNSGEDEDLVQQVLLDMSQRKELNYLELFNLQYAIPINRSNGLSVDYIYPVTSFYFIDDSSLIVYSRNTGQKEVRLFQLDIKGNITHSWSEINDKENFSGVVDFQIYNGSVYFLDALKMGIRQFDMNGMGLNFYPVPHMYNKFCVLNDIVFGLCANGVMVDYNDFHELNIYNVTQRKGDRYLEVNNDIQLQIGSTSQDFSNLIDNEILYARQYDPCIYSINSGGVQKKYFLQFSPDWFVTMDTRQTFDAINEILRNDNGIYRYFCLSNGDDYITFFMVNATLNERYFARIDKHSYDASVYTIKGAGHLFDMPPLNPLGSNMFGMYVEAENITLDILESLPIITQKSDYLLVFSFD